MEMPTDYIILIVVAVFGLALGLFTLRAAKRHRAKELPVEVKTEYEYFVDFHFLNCDAPDVFQIDQSVVDRLRSALTKEDKALFNFDTIMQRRCVVNLAYVTSANIYRDEKISSGIPIDGLYVRLLGHVAPIDVIADTEHFSDQLEKYEQPFLEADDLYVNRQFFMMAAYDIA
jgi:hypothetical protein